MKASLIFSTILVLITVFDFGVGAKVPSSVFGDPSTRKALTDVFLNSGMILLTKFAKGFLSIWKIYENLTEIQLKLARIFSIGLLQRFHARATEAETRAELPICVFQVISFNASDPAEIGDLNLVFPPGTSSGIALGAFHSW
jgi:hypothetical protein